MSIAILTKCTSIDRHDVQIDVKQKQKKCTPTAPPLSLISIDATLFSQGPVVARLSQKRLSWVIPFTGETVPRGDVFTLSVFGRG